MGEARACFRRAIASIPRSLRRTPPVGELWTLRVVCRLPPTEAFLAMRRFAEEAQVRAPELADPTICSRAFPVVRVERVRVQSPPPAGACDRTESHWSADARRDAVCTTSSASQAWMAIEQALRVDPLGEETRTWLLVVAWLTTDFDRQIKEAGQLIDEHPGYSEAFRWRSIAYTASVSTTAPGGFGNVRRLDQHATLRVSRTWHRGCAGGKDGRGTRYHRRDDGAVVARVGPDGIRTDRVRARKL